MRTAVCRAYLEHFYMDVKGLLKGNVDPLSSEERRLVEKHMPIVFCGLLAEISLKYYTKLTAPYFTHKRLAPDIPRKVGTNPTAILRWLDNSMTTTYGKGPGRRAAPLASILEGKHPRAGRTKGGGRVDDWQRIVLSVMKERAGLNYREAAAIWALVERRDPLCDDDRDVVEAFRYVDRSSRKRQLPR